jgi:hypothetical protein
VYLVLLVHLHIREAILLRIKEVMIIPAIEVLREVLTLAVVVSLVVAAVIHVVQQVEAVPALVVVEAVHGEDNNRFRIVKMKVL